MPFTFFVSGAASQLLVSFIPFLRETYGFSYDLSGALLSFQSAGNLLAALLAGFLPLWVGQQRSILITAVWMMIAYIIYAYVADLPHQEPKRAAIQGCPTL